MKILKPFAFIVLLVGGVTILNVCSVQGASISISPVTFELTANSGDILVNKIRIYNPSDSTIAVRMEVEDFSPMGELGEVIVAPEEEMTYSLKRWVRTEPTEFTLKPREQRFINFTINIPDNAEPGGKYGSILASTVGVAGPDITGAAIAQKVGALVLLTVSGEVEENLIVKEFTVPNFSEYGPVPFSIRFENTGTVHIRPRGFVTVFDWRGNKIVDIEFPQQNVIPGAIRKIEVSWDRKWLIGRYTATLIGSYGTANLPLKPPVVVFWVFPWKMALGISLGLMAVITYFVKTRGRWRTALRVLIKGE